jgi:hypothetical protein
MLQLQQIGKAQACFWRRQPIMSACEAGQLGIRTGEYDDVGRLLLEIDSVIAFADDARLCDKEMHRSCSLYKHDLFTCRSATKISGYGLLVQAF